MTNLEMLFVRACKSKNPKKRLKSLVKRFYIPSNEHDIQQCLEHNLLQIAEKYNCISLSKFVEESSSTYVEIEVKYKESSGFAGGWFNPPEEKEIEIQYYTILKAEYGNLTEKQASIVEQIIVNYFEESLNDILYDRINSDI